MWIISSVIGKIIGDLLSYYVLNINLQTILIKSVISMSIILFFNFIMWFVIFKIILFFDLFRDFSEELDEGDD